MGDGIIQPSLMRQGNAAVVVTVGREGQVWLPGRCRLLRVLLTSRRLIEPAKRQADGTKIVPRLGMTGIGLHDLPIDKLGLTQVACLVVLRRQGQSFGNGCHVRCAPRAPLRRLRVAAKRG